MSQSLCTDDCAEAMVDRYAKTVYKLAYAQTRNRHDADDIFQEVFLRFIRKKPAFENETHQKAWFIRVTVNCCKKLWASSFRMRTQPLTEDIPIQTAEEISLTQYLSKLPANYRTVIHLFYYEDMSTAEIAETLKRKESTVRMQLTRARRLLKRDMEGDFHV